MKTVYQDITEMCLHKKDTIADEAQQDAIADFIFENDIEMKFDYEKEMMDVQKVLAIKRLIMDASLKMDKYIQQFNIELMRLTYINYDNCSKYVSIVCDRYKICNDIRNIILAFAIDKKRYNKEKREKRKQKKLIPLI